MSKFKAGDWVRRVSNPESGMPIGQVRRVVEVRNDGSELYFSAHNDDDFWFSGFFELVGDPTKPEPILLTDATPQLAEQMLELVTRFNAAIQVLDTNLSNPDFVDEILGIAASRVVTGFEEHGDAMFGWDVDRLMVEAKEELADFVVYISRMLKLLEIERDDGEPCEVDIAEAYEVVSKHGGWRSKPCVDNDPTYLSCAEIS